VHAVEVGGSAVEMLAGDAQGQTAEPLGCKERRLVADIVAAALVKSAAGLWFHFFVALPRGIDSPVILSHSETLVLCLAVALLATRWLERPDAASLRRG